MNRKPVSSKAIFALITGGLVLPIAISVILALGSLLEAMHDAAGGAVLRYVALAFGAAWAVLLICLILLLALNSVGGSDEKQE